MDCILGCFKCEVWLTLGNKFVCYIKDPYLSER